MEGCDRKISWPICMYDSDIRLEQLSKTPNISARMPRM
jgi:hypothetical protein